MSPETSPAASDYPDNEAVMAAIVATLREVGPADLDMLSTLLPSVEGKALCPDQMAFCIGMAAGARHISLAPDQPPWTGSLTDARWIAAAPKRAL